LNPETLARFERARGLWDEAARRAQASLDNLINSSDLNDRTYVLAEVVP